MGNIIEVSGLTKSFGELRAVRGMDLSVRQGSLFAFLGPNGAGKSTTIDMLTTQLKPDGGEATVNGYKLGTEDDGIRSSIGIVFQESLLDPLLTVKENLTVRGSFYKLKGAALKAAVQRAAEVADATGFLERPYGKLSGGQRRRADIARALIHTPAILFLDEPTTGLDPQTRQNVWGTIRELQRERGMTIFLTTHYMEEAADADYVTVMDHGAVKAQGTPYELKELYATDVLKLKPRDAGELERFLGERSLPIQSSGGIYQVPLRHTTEAIGIIDGCKDNIAGLEIASGTMDDVFLNLTGREIRG